MVFGSIIGKLIMGLIIITSELEVDRVAITSRACTSELLFTFTINLTVSSGSIIPLKLASASLIR